VSWVLKVLQTKARSKGLRVSSQNFLFNYTQILLFLKRHHFGRCTCSHLIFSYRNCLAGQAPVYLRELCLPVSSLPGRRSLRSAEQGDLVVPRVRLATAQRRSFAVVGPSFWNALPSRLRSELLALSLPLFRS